MNKEVAKRVLVNLLATLMSYVVLMFVIFFSSEFLIEEGDPFLGITKQSINWFIEMFMKTPLKWFGYTLLTFALLILPAIVFRSVYRTFNK